MPRMKPDPNWPDSSLFIGLEIEAEGIRYDNSGDHHAAQASLIGAGWSIETDGSLRHDGREFKFATPMCGADITAALDTFFRVVSFSPCYRAGVHIHVDWTTAEDPDSVATLMAISYAIEPAIFNIAGEGRKEAVYCRPVHEIDPERMATALRTGSFEWMHKNLHAGNVNSRYYGVNISAIAKHGTVEFRHFPSLCDRAKIETWIKLVMLMRIASTNPSLTPAKVCEITSTQDGVIQFCKDYFGFQDMHTLLLDNMDIAATASRMKIMSGLVQAKPIAAASNLREAIRNSPSVRRYIDKKHPTLLRQAEHWADLESFITSRSPIDYDALHSLFTRATGAV